MAMAASDDEIEAALATLSAFPHNEKIAARIFDCVLDFTRRHRRGIWATPS